MFPLQNGRLQREGRVFFRSGINTESIFQSSLSDYRTTGDVLKLQQREWKWTLEKNCDPLKQIAWEDCGIAIFRVPHKAQINYV